MNEQIVKANFLPNCALLCTIERNSGRTCSYYFITPLRESGQATCKYGYLKSPENYSILKKSKSTNEDVMIRVLTGETFGKF